MNLSSDTEIPKADQDSCHRWLVGTRLKVEVLRFDYLEKNTIRIHVGTKRETVTDDNVVLGKVRLTDLPPVLS